MPETPYTWQTDDWPSASRLNNELYRAAGSYLRPNGIGWHSQKPYYMAATFNSPPAPASGAWGAMGGSGGSYLPGSWTVVADTAGFVGARLDGSNIGILNGSGLLTGGGIAGSPGGIALAMVTMPFLNNVGTVSYCGTGLSGASSPVTGHITGCYGSVAGMSSALDLVDLASNETGWMLTGGSITPNVGAGGSDNSGGCGRLQAAWASVYPANGQTVGSLPAPIINWTTSIPLTSTQFNNEIRQPVRLLNMPPLLRVRGSTSATTSVPNNTVTTLNMGTPTYDTYSAFNSSTNVYTVPLKGAYLVYVSCAYNSALASTGLSCGVKINGTQFSGPVNQPLANPCGCMKVQIFDLAAGDTLQPVTTQFSGGTVSTSNTTVPCFVVMYLGQTGALPITAPVDSDPTFSYTAGTPGATVASQFNQFMTNDLSLLMYKPYCMAYQTAAQTGISDGAINGLTLGTVAGIVHATNGDPYSGFSSGAYTAPVDGYYLAVQETAMATPSLTTNPRIRTGFQLSTGGSSAQDWYQLIPEHTSGTSGGGAAAFGMYYLRAGMTIQPVFTSFATSSTTTSTSVVVLNSHFEVAYLGG